MKLSISLLALFILAQVHLSFQQDQCPNNCSSQGTCSKGVCKCDTYYGGFGTEDCSSYWPDDSQWYAGYIVGVVYSCILAFILIAFTSYQLVFNFISARKTKRPILTIVTWTLLQVWIGCICAFVAWALPPDVPLWEYTLIDNFFDMFLISASFTIVLYWVELQTRNDIQNLLGIQKLRPVLIGFIALTFLAETPTLIIASVPTNSKAESGGNYAHVAAAVILLLCIIFISFVWGRRLMKDIGQLYSHTRSTAAYLFMRKITVFIFGVNGLLILIMIEELISLFVNSNPWGYLVLTVFVKHGTEFAAIMTGLLVVQKKAPPAETKDSDQSGSTSNVSLSRTPSANNVPSPQRSKDSDHSGETSQISLSSANHVSLPRQTTDSDMS